MSAPTVVETAQGRVEGRIQNGTFNFMGLPFARPPVGPLRFQPPQPAEPWAGVRPALRNGPVPIQAALPLFRFLNAGAARQSEDCLYLNVWTPAPDARRRPVLVWIHGGGFLVGSGSTAVYNGEGLAARGDMVVVTLNYRLGALGFIHLDRVCGPGFEQASNLGLRDQLAALAWVRENIERFGGDPANITVCGQSAGAMSVAALLGTDSEDRVFKRAILQSGAAGNVASRSKADQIAEAFLAALDQPRRTQEALGEIPTHQILQAQGRVNREFTSASELMVMVPCVDGELVPRQPLSQVATGAVRDVDLMIGTTLDEWKLFSPLEARLPSLGGDRLQERFAELLPIASPRAPGPRVAAQQYRNAVRERGGRTTSFEVWSAYQSARVFHQPAAELARAHAHAGGRVHSYLFSWRPPALRHSVGACHAIDIPFVFGLLALPVFSNLRFLPGLMAPAQKLSGRMQDAWAGFVRSGEPGHAELPQWDLYDTEHRASMRLDRECGMVDRPLDGELQLIESWR
ncbi:MAG: carboxylesterase/lipase family protein [Myxococcota bacterium]|nr:carboxylesterase/lipase family protein [Myxococcota bacterium]